jgi:hypothetical protein
MNLREALFSGWSGCSNGDCVVRDNSKGMHTNASCKCVVEANRAQLYVLQSRLNRLVRQPEPDVSELVDAVWSEYDDSVKNKWQFRREHLENALRAALAKHGGES